MCRQVGNEAFKNPSLDILSPPNPMTSDENKHIKYIVTSVNLVTLKNIYELMKKTDIKRRKVTREKGPRKTHSTLKTTTGQQRIFCRGQIDYVGV